LLHTFNISGENTYAKYQHYLTHFDIITQNWYHVELIYSGEKMEICGKHQTDNRSRWKSSV